MRPSNFSKHEYRLRGILTVTCFLLVVEARLHAKPSFCASTAVEPVSKYQKEFLATLLE